jgi:hypothetical protein
LFLVVHHYHQEAQVEKISILLGMAILDTFYSTTLLDQISMPSFETIRDDRSTLFDQQI